MYDEREALLEAEEARREVIRARQEVADARRDVAEARRDSVQIRNMLHRLQIREKETGIIRIVAEMKRKIRTTKRQEKGRKISESVERRKAVRIVKKEGGKRIPAIAARTQRVRYLRKMENRIPRIAVRRNEVRTELKSKEEKTTKQEPRRGLVERILFTRKD